MAHLLAHHLLHGVTVLLDYVPAPILGHISALQALVHVVHRRDGLLLALFADPPELVLAVLNVVILLDFLGVGSSNIVAILLRVFLNTPPSGHKHHSWYFSPSVS